MLYEIASILIVLLPLASFLILALFGKRILPLFAGIMGTALLAIVTALAIFVSVGYFTGFGLLNGQYVAHTVFNYNWLQFSEQLSINMGIVLDPISVMMLIVISVVSLMVHIFSLSYMKGEPYFSNYYAYLSLFTFSMLGLVVSVNLFQMYIFWELVGVSSFLLIGFYFTKPSAIAAAKKAFIVTRFADLGFLIGILILGYNAQTFDFATLIERLTLPGSEYIANFGTSTFMGLSLLSWALLLVFMGGAGKSAMFPLHIWLPDAMEGPTPVSALIHAATMVVAGVFLVARLFPVFSISAPDALAIVAYVGAFSALFAAIIACTQTDIKRVLAYSTISQIGFMMFALGVAKWGAAANEGFTASMFHLFTHAFFKALLFLGAGAVIHAVHSNETADMGGLRKSMPLTHITFLLACLAIAGVPPFSGFFSKEAILAAAYNENLIVFYTALITSGLTAFYMFRLYFLIFWNKTQPVNEHSTHHGNGAAINISLIVLTIGAVFAGLIPFGKYVSADGLPVLPEFHLLFALAPIAFGLAGIAIAALLYARQSQQANKAVEVLGGIYRAAYRKFYIDEVYLFITQKIVFNLIGRPAAWFDRNVVDGIMNGLAWTTERTSNAIKNIQSGNVQSYAMFFLGGLILLFVILVKTI